MTVLGLAGVFFLFVYLWLRARRERQRCERELAELEDSDS